MPLIHDFWRDGHPNAGATLTFHYYGTGDDANFWQLSGEAMGYTSIELKADDLNTLVEDAWPWLKKYGVATVDSWLELLEEWQDESVDGLEGPHQVYYRTAGIEGEWIPAREGLFNTFDQAKTHRELLKSHYSPQTEYMIGRKP